MDGRMCEFIIVMNNMNEATKLQRRFVSWLNYHEDDASVIKTIRQGTCDGKYHVVSFSFIFNDEIFMTAAKKELIRLKKEIED